MPTVFIPARLQAFSGGRTAVEVDGGTVKQAIGNLEQACPGIGAQLLEDGRLRSNIRVAVDGVVSPMGLRERTEPGSEIHFVAAVSGGANSNE